MPVKKGKAKVKKADRKEEGLKAFEGLRGAFDFLARYEVYKIATFEDRRMHLLDSFIKMCLDVIKQYPALTKDFENSPLEALGFFTYCAFKEYTPEDRTPQLFLFILHQRVREDIQLRRTAHLNEELKGPRYKEAMKKLAERGLVTCQPKREETQKRSPKKKKS